MSKRLLTLLRSELEKESLETEDSDQEEDLWLSTVVLMCPYSRL